MTAAGGVATFSDLTLTQADSGEYLERVRHDLANVDTNTFTVTALAATQLGISSFGNVTAGVTFSVTVDAETRTATPT